MKNGGSWGPLFFLEWVKRLPCSGAFPANNRPSEQTHSEDRDHAGFRYQKHVPGLQRHIGDADGGLIALEGAAAALMNRLYPEIALRTARFN